MRRLSALIQVTILLLVLGYGTLQLFRGNFGVMFATMPFLVFYYFFILSRRP